MKLHILCLFLQNSFVRSGVKSQVLTFKSTAKDLEKEILALLERAKKISRGIDATYNIDYTNCSFKSKCNYYLNIYVNGICKLN